MFGRRGQIVRRHGERDRRRVKKPQCSSEVFGSLRPRHACGSRDNDDAAVRGKKAGLDGPARLCTHGVGDVGVQVKTSSSITCTSNRKWGKHVHRATGETWRRFVGHLISFRFDLRYIRLFVESRLPVSSRVGAVLPSPSEGPAPA